MGRTSRRYRDSNKGENLKEADRYCVGIYARVSVKNSLSESINNQIALAQQFIKDKMKCCTVIKIKKYIDEGVSGFSIIDRTGIKRLIEDIRLGKINCVVVKDLSRVGRNYIAVNRFIEKINVYNVRLISINDNYDSYLDDYNKLFNITIKCMFNEMYVRDTGTKIKMSKQKSIREGQYVGVYVPYGYKKINRKLCIDEDAARVVTNIFEVFLERKSISYVQKYLKINNINSKRGYYKTGKIREKGATWTYKSIKDTLINEVYIGNLVQNKTIRVYEVDRVIRKDKNEIEYITIKNNHMPIIKDDIFNKVKDILDRV